MKRIMVLILAIGTGCSSTGIKADVATRCVYQSSNFHCAVCGRRLDKNPARVIRIDGYPTLYAHSACFSAGP